MPTKAELSEEMAELREMNRALLEKLGGVVASEEKPVVFGISPEQVVSEQVAVLKKTGGFAVKQDGTKFYLQIDVENRVKTKGDAEVVASSGHAMLDQTAFRESDGKTTKIKKLIPKMVKETYKGVTKTVQKWYTSVPIGMHNGMEVSFSGMVTLREPYKASEK